MDNATYDRQRLEAHKQYIDRIEKQVAIDKDIAKRKLTEAKAELKRQKDMYSKYQTFQVEDPETYKKHHTGKLEFHQAQINAVNATITASQKELDDLQKALPTREEFVELVHSYLKTILETSDLIEEDAVYREVVSNLRARDNSISVIKLNPPYDMMVDFSENTMWSGRQDLNLRPFGPKPNALPGCATPRWLLDDFNRWKHKFIVRKHFYSLFGIWVDLIDYGHELLF